MLPLAALVGSNLKPSQKNAVRLTCNSLMREVFYRYASDSATNPLVDRHDIEHALGAWSWFWAFIEAATFVAIASFIAFGFGARTLGLRFLIVAL